MHPNLVRPSREQPCREQVHRVKARQPHEVRPCGPAITDDRHPLSVSRIAADRSVDREVVLVEVTPREGDVSAPDPPLREGRRQTAMGFVRLGNEQ